MAERIPVEQLAAMRAADPIIRQLRVLRTERGITLMRVGALIHMAYQTVNAWESGRHEPPISTVRRWARALGYDLVLVPREPPVPD